jgi:hypothetical protein
VPYLTSDEAAARLGITPSTLRVQIVKKRIRGRKRWVTTEEEVERYRKEHSGRFGAASLAHPHNNYPKLWRMRRLLDNERWRRTVELLVEQYDAIGPLPPTEFFQPAVEIGEMLRQVRDGFAWLDEHRESFERALARYEEPRGSRQREADALFADDTAVSSAVSHAVSHADDTNTTVEDTAVDP